MTETETELGSDLSTICPECGESFRTARRLAGHRQREHGVDKPPTKYPPRERSSRRRVSRASMQQDLAQAHFGLCIAAVGVSNPAALQHKPAVDYLQEHSEHWAATLAAVCEQDERVMLVVQTAMHAGVWFAFASASATSLVTVGVMSGRLQIPYGAVAFLAPKLIQIQTDAQAQAERAAQANGNATSE